MRGRGFVARGGPTLVWCDGPTAGGCREGRRAVISAGGQRSGSDAFQGRRGAHPRSGVCACGGGCGGRHGSVVAVRSCADGGPCDGVRVVDVPSGDAARVGCAGGAGTYGSGSAVRQPRAVDVRGLAVGDRRGTLVGFARGRGGAWAAGGRGPGCGGCDRDVRQLGCRHLGDRDRLRVGGRSDGLAPGQTDGSARSRPSRSCRAGDARGAPADRAGCARLRRSRVGCRDASGHERPVRVAPGSRGG